VVGLVGRPRVLQHSTHHDEVRPLPLVQPSITPTGGVRVRPVHTRHARAASPLLHRINAGKSSEPDEGLSSNTERGVMSQLDGVFWLQSSSAVVVIRAADSRWCWPLGTVVGGYAHRGAGRHGIRIIYGLAMNLDRQMGFDPQ
jgi:hypothetical protein